MDGAVPATLEPCRCAASGLARGALSGNLDVAQFNVPAPEKSLSFASAIGAGERGQGLELELPLTPAAGRTDGDRFDPELRTFGDRALGEGFKGKLERIGHDAGKSPDPHADPVNFGSVLGFRLFEGRLERGLHDSDLVHGTLYRTREQRSKGAIRSTMPAGMETGSRRLSTATPPVSDSNMNRTPAGVPVPTRMPSTYTSLHYHLIFATQNRECWFVEPARYNLHEYLGGTVRGLGAHPEAIGGVADHVHLLVSLKATHCLADFMRELKKASSVWFRETFHRTGFHWQEGYAAFTVSGSARNSVRDYIARQEQHHRKRSYREELVEFLQRSEVEFDESHLD